MPSLTQFSQFSMDQWMKVRAERQRLGLEPHPERGQLQLHPLLGQKLLHKPSGELYLVEHVRKDWLQGWFLTAVLNCNGSHRQVMVASLGCVNEAICAQVFTFENEFQLAQ
jgi:hypothetical protein